MPVLDGALALKEEISEYRHQLHENAQTAYEEIYASILIKEKLTEWGIPFVDGVAVTGIVATIDGKKTDSGKSIGLRADMDALNMTEKTNLPYASKNDNKMHACGHDGHTATLLGVAKFLSENNDFNGKVNLIFQPAEEGQRGAHKMIEEGIFDRFPCDYVFGVHNWPWLPVGKMATRVGPLLASVDEFEVTIRGKGGHAASMVHQTIDPAVIAAQIVMAFQTIISRDVDPVDTAVLSVTNIRAGTGAFNIIGDTATLDGTVRAFNNDVRHLVEKRMEQISKGIAASFGAEAEFVYHYHADPTVNTEDGVEIAAAAATRVMGADNVDTTCQPTMGGEDFGAFLMERPGAFVFLGNGNGDENSHNCQGLHSPHYDFNDDVIPVGVSYFTEVVKEYMPL
jgi:amidohydrolase